MREQGLICVICLIVALGALIVAGATIAGGAVGTQGLDAIFVVLASLLAAFAFLIVPLRTARSGALREMLKRKPREEPPAKQAAATAPEKPAEGS